MMQLPIINTQSNQQLAKAVRTISPSVTTTAIQIIGENPNRKGLMIYNNSSNSIYLSFGTASFTSAQCNHIVATFNQYVSGSFCYTGPIYGIRNSGTGVCVVTEFE